MMDDPLPEQVTVGEIIQIVNWLHHWYPCLLVVADVAAWGVQAYAMLPYNDGSGTKRAYIRLGYDDFERMGVAVSIGLVDAQEGDRE